MVSGRTGEKIVRRTVSQGVPWGGCNNTRNYRTTEFILDSMGKQEKADDFFQMAKDYAKAEKELGVQRWVSISIEKADGGNNERLFSYDLPREVYERRRWVIEWRRSRFVCKYPKGNIACYTCYYDKRLGTDIRLNEDLRRLISAKAQVTKVRRKIDEYVAYNRANNMFFNEHTDAALQKAREKLSMRVADVQAAEERLKLKIKQIKENVL